MNISEDPGNSADEANPEKRRIFIVDDHALFREGLRRLIEMEPDLKVCGDASDAAGGLQAIKDTLPDLVIVDISLTDISGIDLIKAIKRDFEDMPVLVVSMHAESLYGDRALKAGAMGYVMKSEVSSVMISAIRKGLAGNVYMSETMANKLVSRFVKGEGDAVQSPLEDLSDRELEVFRMLGQGRGTREIAQEMNVALPTVRSFKNRIKEKLKFKNSTEMILYSHHWFRKGTSETEL